jgi:hypothetical protein
MTPKEKAKELVENYLNADVAWEFTYNCAKQCALLAVVEILNTIEQIFETFEERKYWQEVKQEIEKL